MSVLQTIFVVFTVVITICTLLSLSLLGWIMIDGWWHDRKLAKIEKKMKEQRLKIVYGGKK